MTQPSLNREHAELLLKKAREDESLLDETLESNKVSDEIFGFHCQQAVEKLLKAVLAAKGAVYRRTHDIDELLLLLADNSVVLPSMFSGVNIFTSYAVEYRYDVWPDTAPSLNRQAAHHLVRQLRQWVEEQISA